MSSIKKFEISSWEELISHEVQQSAVKNLEEGAVLYFPHLPFILKAEEQLYLSPTILDPKAKNVSYDFRKDRLAGTSLQGESFVGLKAMLSRYSQASQQMMTKLFPSYQGQLSCGKTSYRPVEIEGRKTSKRKDDTRLHIDAFPSNPTKGERILRFFTNINPEGKSRVWRLGEPVEAVLSRFIPALSPPLRGLSTLLKFLKVTKDFRTPYDHYMLGVHDMMKCDDQYQKNVSQEVVLFPPASSWIVYTDQVSHAAMSGQYGLETTFHIPAAGLKNPATSPLKVMERLLQTNLV